MNRFQGTNSARLCSLAGRYDNPIPSQFLAPIAWLKISAQTSYRLAESIPWNRFLVSLKVFKKYRICLLLPFSQHLVLNVTVFFQFVLLTFPLWTPDTLRLPDSDSSLVTKRTLLVCSFSSNVLSNSFSPIVQPHSFRLVGENTDAEADRKGEINPVHDLLFFFRGCCHLE